MSKDTNSKKQALIKYAEGLKQRLSAAVPPKHAHRPQVFKDMIALDLKKTLTRIEKL
jgi:hypothetical protein